MTLVKINIRKGFIVSLTLCVVNNRTRNSTINWIYFSECFVKMKCTTLGNDIFTLIIMNVTIILLQPFLTITILLEQLTLAKN